MKSRIGNVITAVTLILFPLVLLLLAEFQWGYRANVIMFPWMVGILLISCSVWLLIRGLISPIDKLRQEGELIGESDDPRSSLTKRLFWMASVYPVCHTLGMILGLMLFALAYTSYHRLPWWQRILSALIIFTIVYVGFYKLLGVTLPINPLWMRD